MQASGYFPSGTLSAVALAQYEAMKWFLLLLTGSALPGHCQSLPVSSVAGVDTTQLAEVARLGQHMQLPALPTLRDQRHVRVFTAGKVVDFWQAPAGSYQGLVVQWAREVVPDKEPATQREFVLTQLLAASTVQALFAVLDSCQLLRVPDERAIAGWKRDFLDGVSYTVEYQDAHIHQVALYGNPASQGPLPEAQLVTRFIERLYAISQLRTLTQVFVATIPYGGFTDGSGTMVLRVVPYAQQLAYKRDRQRYRRQQAQQPIPPAGKP